MNNGIKRLGKGLFAIFMIKLTLISGVLIFQACQTETNFDSEIDQQSRDNFFAALKQSRELMDNATSKGFFQIGNEATKGELTIKNSEQDSINWKQVCLERSLIDENLVDNDSIVTNAIVNSLTDVFDLANDTGTRPVVVDDTQTSSDDTSTSDFGYHHTCYYFDEDPIIAAMSPAIVEAKNFLYSKQMTDAEINEILDGQEEYNLVPLVTALIVTESNPSSSSASIDAFSLFGDISYAQDDESFSSRLYDCGMRALGISALQDLIQQGYKSTAGKKALKKAIRKIAARTLSWIGVAWAVFEFTSCMFF